MISILFYGFGEPVYVLLMLASITVNYLFGLFLGALKDRPGLRKGTLVLNVAINLGLLGYFKYAGFAAGLLQKLPGLEGLLAPEIALPIGISFYTFQTMSYTIDVYRGTCAPQKDFVAFGAYVCLFPQLIAGPIVRYVDIEDQLRNRKETLPLFDRGVKLFLVGLAKKVLLANQMGLLWAELKGTADSGMIGSWIGILAFTLQIYFDFSGYSDMARGLGNLFGFEFVKNFDYPYLSRSITEFWRRWHISLGSWFREYVYIPLGGNRKGSARMILNLAITWLLTGLWHGASWNFVLWGGYFGLLLILEKTIYGKWLAKLPAVCAHLYSIFFIMMGWVIFEFTELSSMGIFFGRLFSLQNGLFSDHSLYLTLSYLPLLVIAVFACLPLGKQIWQKLESTRLSPIIDGVGAAFILLLSTAALVSSSYNPFLYFRF